ncbi:hypothetical protein BDZ89DRAFT_1062867 [Hymenopellis radicata]|nr:hypothetical protein BDZ89DRAFT_1062867 [Hymenopellis radicata]
MTGLSLMKETAISFRFFVSGRVHRSTTRKSWATRRIHASSPPRLTARDGAFSIRLQPPRPRTGVKFSMSQPCQNNMQILYTSGQYRG